MLRTIYFRAAARTVGKGQYGSIRRASYVRALIKVKAKPTFSSSVSEGLMLDLKVDIFTEASGKGGRERRDFVYSRECIGLLRVLASMLGCGCAVCRLGSEFGSRLVE
jgi:hypothetical protein